MEVLFMNQLITFPRRSHGFRLGVSSPELFGELFQELANNKHGDLNRLEVLMAVTAASCYQCAWIEHEASGEHAGLAISAFWKPASALPTVYLLEQLALRNHCFADLPYEVQLKLLMVHAVFLIRQTVELMPPLQNLMTLKKKHDCSDLLEYLSFGRAFAVHTDQVDASNLKAMFETLRTGLADCESNAVADSDCLTLGLNAGVVVSGMLAYVQSRHRARA